MATIDTSSIFTRFENIARGVMDEKNLMPAILSGLTFGMFGYVAMRGKTIRMARDIVDDVVTGMAGVALKDLTGGGMALGALAMFVPAYAEIGNMVADSVITISDEGSENDIVAEGDLAIAAGVIAIVTAIAYLFIAPQGDGPITSRLFGGE
jgi:hypothetical protein